MAEVLSGWKNVALQKLQEIKISKKKKCGIHLHLSPFPLIPLNKNAFRRLVNDVYLSAISSQYEAAL